MLLVCLDKIRKIFLCVSLAGKNYNDQRMAPLGIMGDQLRAPLNHPYITQHYRTEGHKGGH